MGSTRTTTTTPDPAGDTGLADVRRALVIGLGVSGRAAADLLTAIGVEVTVVEDRADHPGLEAARAAGLRVVTGEARPPVQDVDLVVPSPGVPESAPVLREAAERGVPVWSEPELAWRHRPLRLLAITGTNGKTSVTELVAAMLAADGRAAVACGNIGTPMSAVVGSLDEGTVLVAELSSFQLRFVHRLRPEVAALLNLADDHLDWHDDTAAYHRAKARIWRAQGADDWAVVALDDPVAAALRDRWAPGRRADVTLLGPPPPNGVGVAEGRIVADLPAYRGPVVALADLRLDAPHHRANVAAAAAVALLAGVDVTAVAEAARTFHPGRHRLELVAEEHGVRYVDDSKATNVHAAAAALRSADRIVWIAGGLAKGADLDVLTDHLGAVRHAVLIGEAADALAEVCARADVPSQHAGSMEEAVAAARSMAAPGDTVLLAPACASFDQFSGYADRGERFAAAARSLTTGRPA
jgi:UDP-N-acetylmuramoylalanine--D-glutamate ligase